MRVSDFFVPKPMKILLHSSKTMKPEQSAVHPLSSPHFLKQAIFINSLLVQLQKQELEKLMHITSTLAEKVENTIQEWSLTPQGTAAALTFRGDIYSGLSASAWSKEDAKFAQEHLIILSGLYGLLRPFDKVKPYRLEMGYKLEIQKDQTLEKYWETELTNTLDTNDIYVNLTANEYYKVLQRQLAGSMVITPKFLTFNKKTNRPVFVTVHAKIARGAFANWLITHKINDPANITGFTMLNYRYDKSLSTPTEPVFICQEFGGLGLSVRLK